MTTLILMAIVGVVDLVVLSRLVYAFKLLRFPTDLKPEVKDLPTISVCVAARNETHAMTQCLERVVASDYPKLEVIVLDDGSRDDTSVLIKSFAHAGVRFVEGKQLPEGWLGKNYAQSILAHEASGKYVFFMDVDTLIERFTIARLVSYLLKHDAKMLSVLPIRDDAWQTSTLMTTMRHFWTMVRFTPNHPRGVSSAWMVERQFILDEFANDKTLPMSMLLETAIARKLSGARKYRLVLSSAWLGLRYEKKYSSQIETSIRLLYPQCDAYILQVLWLMVLLGVTLTPYIVVWWQPWAVTPIVMQFGIAYFYLSKIWLHYRVAGALLIPLTIVQEIWLLVLSTYHYKRGTVTWKGRPISIKPQRSTSVKS